VPSARVFRGTAARVHRPRPSLRRRCASRARARHTCARRVILQPGARRAACGGVRQASGGASRHVRPQRSFSRAPLSTQRPIGRPDGPPRARARRTTAQPARRAGGAHQRRLRATAAAHARRAPTDVRSHADGRSYLAALRCPSFVGCRAARLGARRHARRHARCEAALLHVTRELGQGPLRVAADCAARKVAKKHVFPYDTACNPAPRHRVTHHSRTWRAGARVPARVAACVREWRLAAAGAIEQPFCVRVRTKKTKTCMRRRHMVRCRGALAPNTPCACCAAARLAAACLRARGKWPQTDMRRLRRKRNESIVEATTRAAATHNSHAPPAPGVRAPPPHARTQPRAAATRAAPSLACLAPRNHHHFRLPSITLPRATLRPCM
jgi:hypothetical protein